mgnify:CR=1 FL=1
MPPLLLGAAAAWLLSRSITGPLRRLHHASDAIARGGTVVVATHRVVLMSVLGVVGTAAGRAARPSAGG